MGTFMSKHSANLLNINAIDNKASAMEMNDDNPIKKALVGNQDQLPEQLKKAIKAK